MGPRTGFGLAKRELAAFGVNARAAGSSLRVHGFTWDEWVARIALSLDSNVDRDQTLSDLFFGEQSTGDMLPFVAIYFFRLFVVHYEVNDVKKQLNESITARVAAPARIKKLVLEWAGAKYSTKPLPPLIASFATNEGKTIMTPDKELIDPPDPDPKAFRAWMKTYIAAAVPAMCNNKAVTKEDEFTSFFFLSALMAAATAATAAPSQRKGGASGVSGARSPPV